MPQARERRHFIVKHGLDAFEVMFHPGGRRSLFTGSCLKR